MVDLLGRDGAPAGGTAPGHTRGPAGTGRRSLLRSARTGGAVVRAAGRSEVLVALALAVAAVATRLPLQSTYLVNFDAVNFAFAVEGFDLAHHEPHPPGYLGYVLLARAVHLVVDDVNRSLTLLSVASAGAMAAALHLLVRRHATRWSAVAATAMFLAAPLTWYYGVVALSYLPGAALTTGLVLACHHARFERSPRALFLAGVALALLGALRQTDIVLFAPLVAYAAAAFPNPVRWRLGALVAGLSVVWLVPLLVLSGGPAEYLAQSRDLAVLAGGRTSVFGLDPGGMLRNLRFVLVGLTAGVFAAIPLVWTGVRRRVLPPAERRFLLIWTLPSVLVFLLVHTGQIGYVLPLIPAAYVVAGRVLDGWRAGRAGRARSGGARPDGAGAGGRPSERRRILAVAAVAAVVAVDLLAYATVPSAVVRAARDDGHLEVLGVDLPVPAPGEIRPLDVAANDAHWDVLVERAGRSDPARSVILALPNTSVSFRHLGYYLRSHTVYAVGRGLDGDFGHLFTARRGVTDYTVDGLRHPARLLRLSPSVREAVVFDLSPSEVRTTLPADWDRLDDGTYVLTLRVPPGATLRFGGGAGDDLTVSLATPP